MYLHTKAGAQADGFGFQKYQAGPKAGSGQAQGPAWPGFWPQAGAGTSLQGRRIPNLKGAWGIMNDAEAAKHTVLYASGAWHTVGSEMEHGARCMVHDARCMVHSVARSSMGSLQAEPAS